MVNSWSVKIHIHLIIRCKNHDFLIQESFGFFWTMQLVSGGFLGANLVILGYTAWLISRFDDRPEEPVLAEIPVVDQDSGYFYF